MQLVEAVLLLIVLVIISNIISHYLVAVPVALIQAALGLGAALVFNLKLDIATDWFMLLFTAPLLFNDGRRFPKRELWALRWPIFGNAILLVFATMFIGGYFIHWLVPAMPLAASFALAAILSPTDPIAVQSVANRVKLPSKMLHLVSGESLINDASGLIGFKYGIAAAVSGSFFLGQAIGDFAYVAVIGALAGAFLMLLINALRVWLLQQGINDVILHTVMQLVTPFLIYLVVDEGLHASGVIAVVVAGVLATGSSEQRYISALPELRIVSERTWDIIVYSLNGIIFLILGIELPVAMRTTIESRAVSTGRALLDVLLVYLAVLAIRTLWSFANLWFEKRAGEHVHFSTALLSGLSGVRGAITLVGVLAVPMTVANGQPFPERSLMLFIAAGFVVLSLVVAVVGLPLVTKMRTPLETRGSSVVSDEPEAEDTADVRVITLEQAKRFLYQMAVRRLESERRETNQKPVLDLIAEYQDLIRRLAKAEETEALPKRVQDELELRQIGIEGELMTLDQLAQEGQVEPRQYRRLKKHLTHKHDALATTLRRSGHPPVYAVLERLFAPVFKIRQTLLHQRGQTAQLQVEKALAKGGLKYLSSFLKQPEHRAHNYDRQVIYALIVTYRNRIASIKALGKQKATQYDRESDRLRAGALAAERAAVHDLLEQGYITTPMAQKLNQELNYTENAAAMTRLDEA
ncbi:cation:proton antiporter [Lacticaseibacillus mingshuiensis]|uniref:Cation:proton antiporter n=1 Tax=Lacticaseibacillus mingshuiensis TaxID=2799574 RepID=A0ABW4CIU1_9LACO|nr:sodium:proton antiporter [Lacticaseibacillus mingshuiensis]